MGNAKRAPNWDCSQAPCRRSLSENVRAGGVREGGFGGTAWEPFRDKGRAGSGVVAQGAEWDRVTALQGAGVGCDGGKYLPPFEPILRMILIVDDQIEQHIVCGGKRGDDPCGKAICVHRDADGGRTCV